MESSNRYIIVSNSGRGSRKAYRILDLHRLELLPETWQKESVDVSLALNKIENGKITIIEYAPQENEDDQSTGENKIKSCPGCGIPYQDSKGSYCSRCGRAYLQDFLC